MPQNETARRGPAPHRPAPPAFPLHRAVRPEDGGPRGGRRRLVHDFRPGRLIAGVTALTTTLIYAGDANGAWSAPWYVAFPVILTGLLLAGAAGFAHYTVRRRRAATRASKEN